MTALVILPGLDGTGTLLRAFAEAAGPFFSAVQIVAYPRDQVLGYAALEAQVRAVLPREGAFVLLGESFSGPIVLSIAANPPAGLLGVVLSTSFAQRPFAGSSLLAWGARLLPVWAVPMRFLASLLLGRWATPALVDRLKDTLATVQPKVLRARVLAVMRLTPPYTLTAIAVPVLYLRATADRLMPSSAARPFVTQVPAARVIEIVGPHLLLQTAPKVCAEAVGDFAQALRMRAG